MLRALSRGVAVALAGVCCMLAGAGDSRAASQDPPRLVVIISVDQFRGDYIDRYGRHWTHGLQRLLKSGALFPLALYPYMNTVTCAGHATMSTGVFPATHGLPLNAWWDRESGKQVTCTQDPAVKNIGHGGVVARGGDSAWRLRVPTFSDELRLQLPLPPRVVAISLKARSAITLGGHRADLVSWYDGQSGFITSSSYAAAPVPFLEKYLAAHPIEADAGKVWERLMPLDAYEFTDDAPGERPHSGWTGTFPHPLPQASGENRAAFFATWEDTPFADAYLARMASAAVAELGMGRGPGTDFLAVSFSTLDLTGHAFGPRSHEVQDVLARLDMTLDGLLNDLDRLVGKEHYVLALTGDHGVSPVPEQIAQQGVEAGRISSSELIARVDAALAPWLGEGPHVAALIYTDLYFKSGVYEKLLGMPEAMRAVIRAIESVPGVLRAIRSDDITDVKLGVDLLSQTAFHSYAPGRSGDMLIVPRPYYLNSTATATHGTGYRYDARVPVLLAGRGIRQGVYLSSASPADIVPTLARLVGITMSRTDGRVLSEALSTASGVLTSPTAASPARAPQGEPPKH